MKEALKKLCWPVLKPFEHGEVSPNFKPSHRIILNVVGVLFLILASGMVAILVAMQMYGAFIPLLIFLAVGLVALIVGSLGSDRAVSRIWGNKS